MTHKKYNSLVLSIGLIYSIYHGKKDSKARKISSKDDKAIHEKSFLFSDIDVGPVNCSFSLTYMHY